MSAKGRGSVVVKNENYPTPGWAVQRLMEVLGKDLPLFADANWLEPCVGEGAIVNAIGNLPHWETWDIRPECSATHTGDAIEIASQLEGGGFAFEAAITNPPFSIAMKLLLALQEHCDHFIMLLRLNWLESEERHAQLVGNMPDVYILPNRPPFINGETDATAYAWMHWRREKKAMGTVQLLGLTPYEVRYPPETAELRKEQRKAAAAERAKRKAEKLSPTVQAGVEVGQVPAQEPAPVQAKRRVVLLKHPTRVPPKSQIISAGALLCTEPSLSHRFHDPEGPDTSDPDYDYKPPSPWDDWDGEDLF